MSVTEQYYNYDYTHSYSDFVAPNFDTMDPLHFQLSPILWASLVLYSLVFLLGVPGNMAVIWATAFGMKRTVNTIWFLNLAVADLLCCLALPFLAVPIVRNKWELGDFACRLLPSLTILNMFASILLLVAISVDRCALVIWTAWYKNHRTNQLAWGLCGVAWLLALLMTIPSFIFRSIHSDSFSSKVTCGVDYVRVIGSQALAVEVFVATFRFIAGFLIPFMVIATCYGLVLAWVHSSRLVQWRGPTAAMLMVVVISFFVCWLPYHVAGLILAAHVPSAGLYKLADVTQPLVVSLAYFNSCLNPIIYVTMSRGFRGLVCGRLGNIFQKKGAPSGGEAWTEFKSMSSRQAAETMV